MTVAPVDRIIAAQAIEIDRQRAAVSRPRPVRNSPTPPRREARRRSLRRRACEDVWSSPSWAYAAVQATTSNSASEGVDGADDGNAHGKNPSRSEWTPWSCDQSPVARGSARMDYVKDLGGLAGASGSMPARVDGAGAMMSRRVRRGRPARARVQPDIIGTQHGQPAAQQPPLQAGGWRGAAVIVRCRRSDLCGCDATVLGEICMVGRAIVMIGRTRSAATALTWRPDTWVPDTCARRHMRVAGMGASGGRHKLDGDQHDRPPDQRCQPSTRDHAFD